MNKSGKTSIPFMVFAVIALLFLGFIAFGLYNQNVIQEEATNTPSGCADSTGVLTINSISALAGASDPSSPTITCGVNGGAVTTSVTSGTTTFAVGSELTCLISKADYIDKSFTFTMPCGGKVLEAPLYYSTSDNPSIRIKNDDGDFMTDAVAGGATNQTALTAGETLVLEVEFQGTNTEGSGEGIWVIEFPASTSANITDVVLAGAEKVSVPSVHTLNNAGSKSVAFKIPNIVGAEKKTYALSVILGSGKDLAGGVYTDWYGGQEFVDDDKTISSGVEDSDGTAKYENTLDYDFCIN
jgi:hypothetical protein